MGRPSLNTINNKWSATALLFSGRQNPVWVLTPEQQKTWMLLWQQAQLHNKEAILPSQLGYTGCRLQYDEHSHWQLHNGCVSFYDKETVFPKKDEDRQMELFLLNTAPKEVKDLLMQLKII